MSLQLLNKLKLQDTNVPVLQLQLVTNKMCSYKHPTYSFKFTVLCLQLLSKLKLQATNVPVLQLQVVTNKMCSYKCPSYSFESKL